MFLIKYTSEHRPHDLQATFGVFLYISPAFPNPVLTIHVYEWNDSKVVCSEGGITGVRSLCLGPASFPWCHRRGRGRNEHHLLQTSLSLSVTLSHLVSVTI